MRISRPGFPVLYVDEDPPVEEPKAGSNPLPSVAEAMARAQARQTQILDYTRGPQKESPLIQNPQPGDILPGRSIPHSVTEKQEVQK